MNLYLLVGIYAFFVTSLLAKFDEEDFHKAIEKYLRGYHKQHKETIEAKNARQFVEEETDKLRSSSLFKYKVSKKTLAYLKKHRTAVAEFSYKNALEELKNAESKKKEILYLLEYAKKQSEKPRTEEYLLAYRMMKYWQPKIQTDAKENLDKILKKIRRHYRDAKDKLERDPLNIEELELPEELRYYTDPKTKKKHAWIYGGNKDIKIGRKKTRIIVAVPVKIKGKATKIIRTDGSITSPHLSTITRQLPVPEMPTEEEIAEKKYLKQLQAEAEIVIKRHNRYLEALKKNSTLPRKNNIKILRLKPEQQQYTDQENKKHNWLYLGANHKVIKNEKRIICLTVTPVIKEKHLAFFANTQHTFIKSKQVEVILEKGTN